MGFRRSLVLDALDHPVIDSFLEFVKSLHLIHTVNQVSDHRPDFFLFFAKRRERGVRSVELITAVKVSLVFIRPYFEESFGVFRQANCGHASGLTSYPVMLAHFSLAILGVTEHSNHVNASTSERKMVGILSQVDDRLDEVVLYDELYTILIGAYMT